MVALGLIAAEAGLAVVGVRSIALSAAALLIAPGMALLPLLPARLRERPLAAIAAIPALGYAAASVAVITLSRIGVPLEGVSIRLAVGATVVAGLLIRVDGEPELQGCVEALELLGLGAALVAGAVLQARVIGGNPVPGGDWAKYLLYADEIRLQNSLLIQNPFWMLGVPFREDPGVPAVYGPLLLMSKASPGALTHGIWLFASAGILSTFALARAYWGIAGGVLAAVLYAVVPANQDILGWHGLPNVAALALLPLALVYAAGLLSEEMRHRQAAGFALVLLALAATHRLTFTLTVLALGLTVIVGVVLRRGAGRWGLGASALRVAVWAIVLGLGVALDVIARQRTFGGTQSYHAYLDTKLHLPFVLKNLTVPFAAAAVLATVVAAWRLRRDHALIPVLALLVVILGLTFSWVVHAPLYYLRMVYFLPLCLAVLVAASLTYLRRPRLVALVGVALPLAMAASAWQKAGDVREFYDFTNAASLRGLDGLKGSLAPNEVVVTDSCWGFLATWLLRTRTLPSLNSRDIQPKAELAVARQARAVLAGTPFGRRRASELGIRYAVLDPTCSDARAVARPSLGKLIFASRRLAVIRLPPAALTHPKRRAPPGRTRSAVSSTK
jgi:hypothetical protein